MQIDFWIQPYDIHGRKRFQAGCTINGKRFSCCGRGDTALGALRDLLTYF